MINKRSLSVIFLVAAATCSNIAQAQSGMAVNTTGATPDASAILDVASTTKGMLAPRMLSSQRTTISSPATGLLVYQTDAPTGFYVYNGTAWAQISSGGTAGGDLTGTYPNPTIVATAAAGKDVVAAINADTDVINTTNLGRGAASSATYLRGDGTWNTPPSKYVVTMGSGDHLLRMTTNSSGFTDSINVLGTGAAGNQLVNVNGGSYIDVSNTYPLVAVNIPVSSTVTSFSFFFRDTNPSFIMFVGTYTFQAQLYYSAPPSYTLTGSDQFYPVTGATISFNLSSLTGGIFFTSEGLTASVSGLSFPLAVGSRLIILIQYNVSTTPFTLQALTGYATASVGMQ